MSLELTVAQQFAHQPCDWCLPQQHIYYTNHVTVIGSSNVVGYLPRETDTYQQQLGKAVEMTELDSDALFPQYRCGEPFFSSRAIYISVKTFQRSHSNGKQSHRQNWEEQNIGGVPLHTLWSDTYLYRGDGELVFHQMQLNNLAGFEKVSGKFTEDKVNQGYKPRWLIPQESVVVCL